MHSLIRDIALCVTAAWLLGLLARWLRQPLLLAYLLGGFLLSPAGLGWVEPKAEISVLAELGLIFLLFMVGLEIDLRKVLGAGRAITLTALVQIGAGLLLALGLFWLCGFPLGGGKWDALYLAIAVSLSSTVIIVKLLHDRQELDTVGGRITLGILVIQDIAAILFLAVQPALGNPSASVIGWSLAKAILLVAAVLGLSRYLLPTVFRSVARMPELVLVGALAWCFLTSETAAWLGLSRGIGALVAGVALSTFPYALDVAAKATTLRDFFVTLFFVTVGVQIPAPDMALLGSAAAVAVFVIACRFLTTFLPLHLSGLGLRTSILPALHLGQISEFSLVIMGMGKLSGHLEKGESTVLVALAFALLAGSSSLAINRADAVARRLVPWLKRRGFRDLDAPAAAADEERLASMTEARIVLLGFYRSASSLVQEISAHEPDLLGELGVVDFSPEARRGLLAAGVRIVYGDLGQPDTLAHAGIQNAEIVLSTVPDSMLRGTTNLRLLRQVQKINPRAKIIATAETVEGARRLLEAGAAYVHVPRLLEADDLRAVLQAARDELLEEKRSQLEARLAGRSEILR